MEIKQKLRTELPQVNGSFLTGSEIGKIGPDFRGYRRSDISSIATFAAMLREIRVTGDAIRTQVVAGFLHEQTEMKEKRRSFARARR